MMGDSDDFLLEIQDEFLDETVGFLEQTENNFLEMEARPNDHAILENILRLAHNIKGSAAAVGFDGLSHFAHTFENLLVKIKQGEIAPTPEIIDILLASNDMLKHYVDSLRENKSTSVDTSSVADRIDAALQGNMTSTKKDDTYEAMEEEAVEAEDISASDMENDQMDFTAPEISPAAAESLAELNIKLETTKASDNTLTKVDYDALEDILLEETISDVNNTERPKNNDAKSKVTLEKPTEQIAIMKNDNIATKASLKDETNQKEIEKEIKKEIKAPITNTIKAPEKLVSHKPKLEIVDDIHEAHATPILKEETNKAVKKADEFIRLPLRKIEDLLNDLSEQVILQSSLDHLRQDIVGNAEDVNRTVLQLGKITNELQQTAISLRMLSLRGVFSKMQRTIRDTAKILGKDIRFITDGDDTELDKTIIDELSSPLTHLIRNSVDHGIESPEEREAAGKPRMGTVKMSASYSGRYFYLKISDDGKGLDRDRIKQKAIEKGLISPTENPSEQQILQLIFMNSFSTKDEATDISGRGVGMDAIKGAIEKLRGSIDLESEFGKGTTVTIKLPPTLAIFNGIVIQSANQKFIFPSSDVYEIYHINLEDTREMSPGKPIIRIKDEVYPVIDLAKVFNLPKTDRTRSNNVLLTVAHQNKSYGVLVDDIILQQRIVFKNLGRELEGLPGVAGGTILADGRVAMITEIADLVELYESK